MDQNTKMAKFAIPLGLIAVVLSALAVFMIVKPSDQERRSGNTLVSTVIPNPSGLPRLVDLGADQCIPCKQMAPVLEELKKEYAGRMTVDFIDVWKNPQAGKPYGIESIPTQIFYDPTGKELFRHVGAIPKENILAKWKEFGFTFIETTNP